MEQPRQRTVQDQQDGGNRAAGEQHSREDETLGGLWHPGRRFEKRHQRQLGTDADQEQEEDVDDGGQGDRLGNHLTFRGLPRYALAESACSRACCCLAVRFVRSTVPSNLAISGKTRSWLALRVMTKSA